MALRLGVKISSVAGQTVTPIRIKRQFQSLSPVATLRISSNQRAASNIATRKASKQNIIKNANKTQKYSTKDKVSRDFNEYNAVEQYELEAAKPREKMQKVNKVYEFMTKLQQNQNWRILPHLQPSNLRPYGSSDNIIFPESLRQRDLIRYPQEEEALAEAEEELSEKSTPPYSKEEFTNRREYSTFEKKDVAKKERRKMATKSRHVVEENVSVDASETNERSSNKNDSFSEETKSKNKKHWPSYSDILKHEINKDVMTTFPRNFHQSCTSNSPVSIIPMSEKIVGLPIKEPRSNPSILTDPQNVAKIREPVLNPVAFKLRKKPKESWDKYCPEQEEVVIRKECPIIPKRLPKLVPRDCPCIEPPPPCDVPPLPRLDLEVCEPRPECPSHPCETTPRADIDCWEYMEAPEVDCRVIPAKKKGSCNKCDVIRNKSKKCYTTLAFKGNMHKRQYSSLSLSQNVQTAYSDIPCLQLSSSFERKKEESYTKLNNDLILNDFTTYGRNISTSVSTPVLLNKLNGIQSDIISRQYSTNDDKRCIVNENEDTCPQKHKKDCKLPRAKKCKECEYVKKIKCPRNCPQFCLDGCPPSTPRGESCVSKSEVCCEKAQTPYPSYSECLVSYLTPFTNFPNYKCEKCPRRGRPGFYYRKFSTHHKQHNSSLFSSHKSDKGKRLFSTHIRKPLLRIPNKFRKSCIRNKHKRKNPCKFCCDISYPNCPPRCRFNCDKEPLDINCTKRNSPYPSFSECVIEELDEYISECPYNLEGSARLQPKNAMLTQMQYLIKRLPEPGFKPFDPLKEEKCIRSKLCIKNEGLSQCCNDFGKPHAALKTKDFFAPNDRIQCKFLLDKKKRDSRIIKEKCRRNIPDTSMFVNLARTKLLYYPYYRLFSSTTYNNSRHFSQFNLEDCIRCEEKKRAKQKCPKQISPYPSFSEINKPDCFPDVITECPDGDYQDKREKKIKAQFHIPGINETITLSGKSNCNQQPSFCQHTNIKPECEPEPQACSAECLDESCLNIEKMDQPPPGKLTLNKLLCNIINYFKARDCPSPEEFRQMRLRKIAEKAAKNAGLCLCDPKEIKPIEKKETLPKVITLDCCNNKKNGQE